MQVSRSAYYAYRSGTSHKLSAQKAAIGERVKETFYRHRRRYGARRIVAELSAEGVRVGRRLVRSQMRRFGLQAIGVHRFRPQTTDSRNTLVASPNLLREAASAPPEPGAVIVGDITYLSLQSGQWSYLASWQDQFSKRIVGWAVAEQMTEELVIRALTKAVASGSVRAGTIIHTDRGSQYAAKNFRTLLADYGCRQSMSRRGNCYDNAQAESFFSRYKAELLEGGSFADVEQARSETFSYIEGYYNRVRRHSSLGYKTPEEFEREHQITKKGLSSESFVSGNT